MNGKNHPQIQKVSVLEDKDIINLSEVGRTLWHGKWTIALVVLSTLFCAFYYAYIHATPLYRASAVVMLESREQQITDLENVISGLTVDPSVVNTEVEVLMSRSLLEKVAIELNLVDDPEFNKNLQETPLLTKAKNGIKSMVDIPPGRDEILSVQESKQAIIDQTVAQLLEQLTIRNIPLSLVFSITAETTSAKKSAAIANKVVELYILNQLDSKFEATEQATNMLGERVAQLQVNLQEIEAKAKTFKAATSLINLKALELKHVELKGLRARIEKNRQDHDKLVARLAKLKATEQAEDREELANLDVSITRSASQLANLEQTRIKLQTEIDEQSSDLVQLEQLEREGVASRLVYENLLSRLKETSIQQGIQKADSRLLSRASIPIAASAPKKSLIMAMAGLLGLMLGSGIVLGRTAYKGKIRSAKDLEVLTGYKVMGVIPKPKNKSRKPDIGQVASSQSSAIAEAFRNLRTSLLMSNANKPPQIIMMTSALPNEGKTTQSLLLANNISSLGKKVLLIEGDMRLRQISEYSNKTANKGIVSALMNNLDLEGALYREATLNIDILFAGKSNINPTDVFSSEEFSDLLSKLRSQYDFIVIDAPPVLVVPDSRVIGQHVDAILFMAQWNKTSRTHIKESINALESVNLKVTGLVLTQVAEHELVSYGAHGYYAS